MCLELQHSTHPILVMPRMCMCLELNIQHTSYSSCRVCPCVWNFNIQHTSCSLYAAYVHVFGTSTFNTPHTRYAAYVHALVQHSTQLILVMPICMWRVWNFNIQHTSYSLCQYACVLNFNIQHTLYSLCRKSKNELGISYLTLNQKIDVNSSKSLNIFVSWLLSENMLHVVNKKSYYCKLLFFLILGKTAT